MLKLKSLICLFICSVLVWSAQAQLFLQKLPSSINSSEYEEIGPVLSEDGRTLYFTRVASPDFVKKYTVGESQNFADRLKRTFSKISGRNTTDITNSEFNQDIWVADLDNDMNPTKIHHPPYPLNNPYPNSVCSIFPQENSIIVINQFGDQGEIYEGFSKVELLGNHQYAKPVPLEIMHYEDEGSNVNLTMSRDGQHIFISMKRADSKGQNDLYVSVKTSGGRWTKPRPLNGNINTPYNETSPYLTKDKKILLFSSNKPGGMGKQDLYMSKRLDYSYMNWSKPISLGFPVNSEHEDFLATLSDDERYLFFNSNRDGTSDIYFLDMARKSVFPNPITLDLKIIDGITKKPVRADIHWQFGIQEVTTGFFVSYTGKRKFEIKKNIPYLFTIKKRGYDTEIITFEPNTIFLNGLTKEELIVEIYPKGKKKPPTTSPTQEVALKNPQKTIPPVKDNSTKKEVYNNKIIGKELKNEYPLFGKNRKITLEKIYFAKGESSVLSRSIPAIEELVDVLKKNQNLKILIIGHTDNVGDPKALKNLSLQRAEVIKKHLVAYGIEYKKIFTMGLGADEPRNDNSTEQKKRQNRRVEIKIINE